MTYSFPTLGSILRRWPSETITRWMTFEELNQQSDRLAAWLARHDVDRGRASASWLPASARATAAILAIWKRGAAYVPVAPSAPYAFNAMVLDDSASPL